MALFIGPGARTSVCSESNSSHNKKPSHKSEGAYFARWRSTSLVSIFEALVRPHFLWSMDGQRLMNNVMVTWRCSYTTISDLFSLGNILRKKLYKMAICSPAKLNAIIEWADGSLFDGLCGVTFRGHQRRLSVCLTAMDDTSKCRGRRRAAANRRKQVGRPVFGILTCCVLQ